MKTRRGGTGRERRGTGRENEEAGVLDGHSPQVANKERAALLETITQFSVILLTIQK